MNKTQKTIQFLVRYNAWRRGDETVEMPAPEEIGDAIDNAVKLLRQYDEMEGAIVNFRQKISKL